MYHAPWHCVIWMPAWLDLNAGTNMQNTAKFSHTDSKESCHLIFTLSIHLWSTLEHLVHVSFSSSPPYIHWSVDCCDASSLWMAKGWRCNVELQQDKIQSIMHAQLMMSLVTIVQNTFTLHFGLGARTCQAMFGSGSKSKWCLPLHVFGVEWHTHLADKGYTSDDYISFPDKLAR